MSEVSSMRLERTFAENHHCYYDYASQLCSWVPRRRRGRVPQEDRKTGPEEKKGLGVPQEDRKKDPGVAQEDRKKGPGTKRLQGT